MLGLSAILCDSNDNIFFRQLVSNPTIKHEQITRRESSLWNIPDIQFSNDFCVNQCAHLNNQLYAKLNNLGSLIPRASILSD